jgi:hypothetical protein
VDETRCNSPGIYQPLHQKPQHPGRCQGRGRHRYYKKGITTIKLFEKIHEADAHTIGDLMAYVDKLFDTQDAVMHDFNGEDHDDGGNRTQKRSGEAYMADPPRPSTFLEGDFNMVKDD